jgi:hypothetical protein
MLDGNVLCSGRAVVSHLAVGSYVPPIAFAEVHVLECWGQLSSALRDKRLGKGLLDGEPETSRSSENHGILRRFLLCPV